MKKIEITNMITKYLARSPFVFIDLFDCNLRVDSYEKFVQELTLVRKIFKDTISNFYDEASSYLEKMASFLTNCESISDSNLQNHIDTNLRRLILGSSSTVRLNLVFSQSLSASTEGSATTLQQVFQELGYDNLIRYINLLKSPNLLNSYLSNSQNQLVGMHYILFKTNHHSTAKLKRNMSSQTLYRVVFLCHFATNAKPV